MKRCPKCRSSHVRRGYDDPPLLLRMVGIYQFLCDGCNLLFRGFAVPGTLRHPAPPPMPYPKGGLRSQQQWLAPTHNKTETPKEPPTGKGTGGVKGDASEDSISEVETAFEKFIQEKRRGGTAE